MSRICANCGELNRSGLLRCKKCHSELMGGRFEKQEMGGSKANYQSTINRERNFYGKSSVPPFSSGSKNINLESGVGDHLPGAKSQSQPEITVEQYTINTPMVTRTERLKKNAIILSFFLIALMLTAGFYMLANRERYLQLKAHHQQMEKLIDAGKTYYHAGEYENALKNFRSLTNFVEMYSLATFNIKNPVTPSGFVKKLSQPGGAGMPPG